MKTENQLWDEIADLRIKYPEKRFSMTIKAKERKEKNGGLVITMGNVIVDENDVIINYEEEVDKWIKAKAECRERQINSIFDDKNK